MTGTKYLAFGVVGVILLALLLWWGTGFFQSAPHTIDADLAPYAALGDAVKSDFQAYPLLTLSDEYTITDTLKDGIEITY